MFETLCHNAGQNRQCCRGGGSPAGARMTRARWHILREGDALTVARRVPVRFDLAVETVLPRADKLRVAHQVRQDMWRALRGLRGFAPAVRVEERGEMLAVTAGGQVDGPMPRHKAQETISELLECRSKRDRWLQWAS